MGRSTFEKLKGYSLCAFSEVERSGWNVPPGCPWVGRPTCTPEQPTLWDVPPGLNQVERPTSWCRWVVPPRLNQAERPTFDMGGTAHLVEHSTQGSSRRNGPLQVQVGHSTLCSYKWVVPPVHSKFQEKKLYSCLNISNSTDEKVRSIRS